MYCTCLQIKAHGELSIVDVVLSLPRGTCYPSSYLLGKTVIAVKEVPKSNVVGRWGFVHIAQCRGLIIIFPISSDYCHLSSNVVSSQMHYFFQKHRPLQSGIKGHISLFVGCSASVRMLHTVHMYVGNLSCACTGTSSYRYLLLLILKANWSEWLKYDMYYEVN